MSNVPMTRSEEALAQLETTHGFAATFVERADGRILQLTGTLFTTSDDGGLTWSEPFQCHDTNGDLVGDGRYVAGAFVGQRHRACGGQTHTFRGREQVAAAVLALG